MGLGQAILGGNFEPLSSERSGPALIEFSDAEMDSFGASREQMVVPRCTGVISPPISEQGPDGNSVCEAQQIATRSLLMNLKLAMMGRALVMAAQDNSNQEDAASDYSDFRVQEYSEAYQQPQPILSMSTGDRDWINFQADSSDDGVAPRGIDLLDAVRYGTASIQELEPYSDSIITLFGSSSDFLD